MSGQFQKIKHCPEDVGGGSAGGKGQQIRCRKRLQVGPKAEGAGSRVSPWM